MDILELALGNCVLYQHTSDALGSIFTYAPSRSADCSTPDAGHPRLGYNGQQQQQQQQQNYSQIVIIPCTHQPQLCLGQSQVLH